VWFRSIFLKTLRDYRVPILGWGLGVGLLTPLIFLTVKPLLSDPVAREQLTILVRHPAMRLFAEPVELLSPGGYATWRLARLLPMVGIWALLAVSRTTRGEEESGGLDVLLSTPRSRLRVAVEKLAAIDAALLLIGLLIGLIAFVGARVATVDLPLAAALLYGLNTALLAAVFGAVALVTSQFTRDRRAAAGMTGAWFGLSIVLVSAGRTVPHGEWMARLSPLYYFELSKPLVASYGTSARAMVTLAALAAVLSVIGLALFLRRDVGAPIALPPALRRPGRPPLPPPILPLREWSLRSISARGFASVGASTRWWGLALTLYAALLTAILRQAQQNLTDVLGSLARRSPAYAQFVARITGGGDFAVNATFLSAIFTLLVVAVAAFAVTLASRWAAEGEEGRLELLLATPISRWHLILSRFSMVVVALLIVTGLLFAGVAATAALVGMTLDRGRLAEASFGMVPVGLVVAAVGYLLAGWLRAGSVTGILIALLAGSFIVTLLGPFFNWPTLVREFSVFEQYGTPLVSGLRLAGMVRLLVVAGAALAVAVVRFARKDLAQ
jgi:ABC-2 type transport system permease protein